MVILSMLGISIVLQLVAAFLALRLIALTGKRLAWILIAAAVLFMAIRRLITLYQILAGFPTQPFDLLEESATLLISALMLVGIAWIKPVFADMRASEQALEESEERFRSIFDNTPVGLYRTTPDGQIVLVNPALVHMLGYESAEELSERNLDENYPDPGTTRSQLRRRIENDGELKNMEAAWLKKDGSRLYVPRKCQGAQRSRWESAIF